MADGASGPTLPSTIAWLVLSVAALGVMQLALYRCPAIRVVPAFTCAYVIVPVIGGILNFGEGLQPLQFVGVAVMVAGVVAITTAGEDTRRKDPGQVEESQSVEG